MSLTQIQWIYVQSLFNLRFANRRSTREKAHAPVTFLSGCPTIEDANESVWFAMPYPQPLLRTSEWLTPLPAPPGLGNIMVLLELAWA